MSDSKEDRIRARAHTIWLSEGQPDGHEARHWQQASDEIDAEDSAKAKQAPAKKAPAKKVTAAAPKKASAPKPAKTVKTKA